MSQITLHEGDNRVTLRRLIDQGVRVHSVVTDPPYGLVSVVNRFAKTSAQDDTKTSEKVRNRSDGFSRLVAGGFMGKQWDATGIERDPEFWRLIWEILLPGGYVFAFSGSRTGHWQACAMEQAGFIMHPMHGWVFGSGFPKAHAADKAIDKHFGAEREVLAIRDPRGLYDGKDRPSSAINANWRGAEGRDDMRDLSKQAVTAPATPEAAQWEGWAYGTQAQKPALEPIYLGQKPFSEKTGAANLLKHGVGAVNIDGCRVPTADNLNGGAYAKNPTEREAMWGEEAGNSWRRGGAGEFQQPEGRHPANLLLDGAAEVVALFPNTKSGKPSGIRQAPARFGMQPERGTPVTGFGDEGSAARFFHHFAPDTDPIFYHPKAGKLDRMGSKHPCLLPGEEVLTDRGYRPIDTIKTGDLVLADDGTFRPVVDQFPSPADTKVYEIHVEGTNHTTTATDNHPFLVYRAKRRKAPFASGHVAWMNAEEVRVGDYLLTPVVSEEQGAASHDADWWFVFGLWVAEGCRLSGSNGSTYPSLTISKRRNLDLMDLLQKRFASVSAYDRGGAFQVVIFEAGLLDTYISMAGYGAKGKFISREILRQPKWAKEAFLEGYLRGDGCVVKGRHRASTASDDLAATLPLLAASIGLKCSSYRYDATGTDSMIDGRTIPGGIVHKMYFSAPTRITHDGVEYDLRRVKRNLPRDYIGPVWNITVEGRHTFQTRVGMSHNTVKPIALMQYLIRHITPPGGVVLDPFAGSGTTAEAARREGFDCILMEAEQEYIEFLRGRFDLGSADDGIDLLAEDDDEDPLLALLG